MISSLSVDLAVTFSLPGVPASSSSICHKQIQTSQKTASPLLRVWGGTMPTVEVDCAHLGWDKFADELDAVALHVLASAVGHVLVEASQQDGSHHDGDVKAQTCQETTALQSHVRGPDHQGLPRAVGQREEVVAGDRRRFQQ